MRPLVCSKRLSLFYVQLTLTLLDFFLQVLAWQSGFCSMQYTEAVSPHGQSQRMLLCPNFVLCSLLSLHSELLSPVWFALSVSHQHCKNIAVPLSSLDENLVHILVVCFPACWNLLPTGLSFLHLDLVISLKNCVTKIIHFNSCDTTSLPRLTSYVIPNLVLLVWNLDFIFVGISDCLIVAFDYFHVLS